MKKLFLTTVLLHLVASVSTAQNRSIVFEETKVWQQIVDKAKAENKFVFVDCYTDWCGPCKILVTRTFTQDNVADFFNENFVNAKFEMEKDAEGIANKAAWAVAAYPTLLFIDPASGEVVHRLVGAGQPDWLIEGGKVAMDPANNLASMTKRYEDGNRSPEFITAYLKALGAGVMKERETVALDYLEGMTLDQFTTPDMWEIIRNNISDPLSEIMKTVIANKEKFYDIEGVGQKAVDQYLARIIANVTNSFISDRTHFDEVRYGKIVDYYKTLDMPTVKSELYFLGTAGKAHDGDWRGVLTDVMKVVEDKELLGDRSSSYENTFFKMLGKSEDRDIIGQIIAILEGRIVAADESYGGLYTKSNYTTLKSELYRSVGNDVEADKAETESEKFKQQAHEVLKKENPAAVL